MQRSLYLLIKKKKLCNAIIGIDDSAADDSDADDNVTQKWKQFTHIIFYDNSILKEIYKTIKSNELCFFNEISFKINPETLTDETLWKDYYIMKHVGKQTQFSQKFIPDLYYKTNIENCKHQYMAIPISYSEIGAKSAHANMLIIHKDENTIKVEHFEPHGDYFSYDEEKNEKINKYIDRLVYSLFVRNGYTKEDIEIIHPEQLCNLKKSTHSQLQQLLSGTEFSGTCTIFSMWYSFYRLLYPSLSSEEVYRQMNDRLERSTNRTETIKMIIQTFLSLIKINIDDYTISGERKFHPVVQYDIKKIRGVVGPDSDANITKFIRGADLATMKEMMENGNITNVDVQDKTSNGYTALMYKTLHGNIDQMKWLLDKKANVDLRDYMGMSAIHNAVRKDDVDKVELLLKYNPKLNIINKYGKTLLEYADGLSTSPKIISILEAAMKS